MWKNMFRKIKIDKKPISDQRLGKVNVNRRPSYRIDKQSLDIKADPAHVEIDWYSEESKKSDHIENEFTNYVEDFITDYQVEHTIEVLNNGLDVLKKHKLDTVDINYDSKGKRIKEIIELYFKFRNPREEYWFVKTDIKTEFQSDINSAGSSRIVMVNAKDMETKKHYLQILFVDPYHLFIPGRHKGKSAEETKKETYEKCSDFETCLSKYLK